MREESPLSNTVYASLKFGPAGFIVDGTSYPHYSYEVTASRLKGGCGEMSLINGVVDLINGVVDMMREVNRK